MTRWLSISDFSERFRNLLLFIGASWILRHMVTDCFLFGGFPPICWKISRSFRRVVSHSSSYPRNLYSRCVDWSSCRANFIRKFLKFDQRISLWGVRVLSRKSTFLWSLRVHLPPFGWYIRWRALRKGEAKLFFFYYRYINYHFRWLLLIFLQNYFYCIDIDLEFILFIYQDIS